MKKGQATPFIIVGIIVAILIVIVVFISRPTAIGGKLSVSQVQPIKNYIDECINTKVDNELENLRKYGGYFSQGVQNNNFNGYSVLFDINNGEIVRGINDEIVIEARMNELLSEYLTKECDVEKAFDEFSISKRNLVVKTDVTDEAVNVNVNWDVIIRKGLNSINLNEFGYVKKEDVGWINRILVPYIIDNEKGPNEREYLDNNGEDRVYYVENGKTKGVEITYKDSYKIYSVQTRFDKKEGLDGFVFAVKYK